MRILFMGTGDFAVPALLKLLNSEHEVIGVVTQPDRESGRGRKVKMPLVKQCALDAGVPIFQPEKVRSPEFIQLVREMAPDLSVVASYGQIISQALLDIPRLGNVNIHGSLLPKYRGAAPIHYALFNGDAVTGVTTMLMEAGLDMGPMLLKREVTIKPDDDRASLEAELSEVGADLLIETINLLERGKLTPISQDDSLATYAPSIRKDACLIDWNIDACHVAGRIRGCSPKPGAFTHWQGCALKLLKCSLVGDASTGSPGEIIAVTSAGMVVGTGEGSILITEVQPENRNRMSASEFARGYKVQPGMMFSCK
ncbi:MAG: methionyl-tRNA formyltransferase [Armatimonadota bacterium]